MIVFLISIITILILGIVGFLIWTYKEEIKAIIEVRKRYHRDESLLINQIVDDAANRIVYCPEDWTNQKEEELIPQGYIFLEKAKSDLRYLGIPVYFRLSGFSVVDLSDDATAKKFGLPRANRIGSSAQHDFLKSNTLSRFMAGFTKVGFAPIDMKMLAVVAPILIGVVIGMAYFMGWF